MDGETNGILVNDTVVFGKEYASYCVKENRGKGKNSKSILSLVGKCVQMKSFVVYIKKIMEIFLLLKKSFFMDFKLTIYKSDYLTNNQLAH